jgi:hypothetical protein
MGKEYFKAFNKDFTCNNFQYKVGEEYKHEGEVKACSSGFHSCENPFDVWNYYNIDSKYAVVTIGGKTDIPGGDSKICSAKIKIEAELSLSDFIVKAVDRIVSICKDKIKSSGSSGDYAQIGSSGYYAQIGSSGNYAQIGSSGDYAQIGSSGYYAQIGSSGYSAQIGSSGNYAQIGSSGDYAKINCEGKNGVIASAGIKTKAKGVNGTWISLAEFDSDGKCVGFATGCIGKDGLHEDTYYVAKNGKLELEAY